MAIIDVAIPSSQTATTTINAQPGDVINIPAGMMGNITINGGPDVTVNILGDPAPSSSSNQLTLGGWGSDIEPTVNIPAGTDFSRYNIDANGENLTLNVGDGATLGSIDATGMSNTGTLTINAGNDVTIDGSINNYGADADFTFGSGATVTGTTTATSVGDADVTFGDNATFGADVSLSSGNTANVNATFGDGLDLTGQLKAGNGGNEMNIAIGNDATITNALNLTGSAPTNLTIGDNVTLLGNINLASSDDNVVIGDNWDLANVNMNLGDDNITLGMQAEAAGLTQIDGGNPNGYDSDGITITARPDQVQDFIDAGYINNGDGTFSAPPPAFNGSPVTADDDVGTYGSVTSTVAVRDFEKAAPPLPEEGIAVDGENTGEVMNPGYDDANAPTDGGGQTIDGPDGINDTILGNGGDDTIDAGLGDDLVSGGSGSDVIDGNEGNDTIYGDQSDAVIGDGERESFNWDLVSQAEADSTVTQDTGNVAVTYTRLQDTGAHESDVNNSTVLNTAGIDGGGEVVDPNSSLYSETSGQGNTGEFQWDFSEPVTDVEFNVNDLDGDGLVTVRAYDADGNEIPVTLTGGSDIQKRQRGGCGRPLSGPLRPRYNSAGECRRSGVADRSRAHAGRWRQLWHQHYRHPLRRACGL